MRSGGLSDKGSRALGHSGFFGNLAMNGVTESKDSLSSWPAVSNVESLSLGKGFEWENKVPPQLGAGDQASGFHHFPS